MKQLSLFNGVPKTQTTDLDGVLDRLREHTLSSAASVDMKTLSRSSSFDLSVGVGGAGSSSVLQQTLSRRMSVTNKSFVDSLERSVSPLNVVPRTLSPAPTNSRSNSPNNDSRQASPPKRLAGLNVFEEINEENLHDVHTGQSESQSSFPGYPRKNSFHQHNEASQFNADNSKSREVQCSSFLDEPETIVDDVQQYPGKNRYQLEQEAQQPNDHTSIDIGSGSASRSFFPSVTRSLSH